MTELTLAKLLRVQDNSDFHFRPRNREFVDKTWESSRPDTRKYYLRVARRLLKAWRRL